MKYQLDVLKVPQGIIDRASQAEADGRDLVEEAISMVNSGQKYTDGLSFLPSDIHLYALLKVMKVAGILA